MNTNGYLSPLYLSVTYYITYCIYIYILCAYVKISDTVGHWHASVGPDVNYRSVAPARLRLFVGVLRSLTKVGTAVQNNTSGKEQVLYRDGEITIAYPNLHNNLPGLSLSH